MDLKLLNYDCLRNVIEHLEYNKNTLFKCLLVNRSWCKITIPYLWKNPFSIVSRPKENSKKLLTTIISMFPFDEKSEDKLKTCDYELIYLKYESSIFNYLSFLRIFKSNEFHAFIDKCTRREIKLQKNEDMISSILSFNICKIIFKHCKNIRQIKLLTINRKIINTKSFNNLSNINELEIGNLTEVQCIKKLAHICKKINKIIIIVNVFRNSQELVNLFEVQQNLKIVHFLSNLTSCQIIPKELSTQIYSIEKLYMKNFMFSPLKQINSFSKLKHLEISLTTCSPQTITIFQKLSCPLLKVLKFHDDFPPLDVLANFIEKTEGHLQCFNLEISKNAIILLDNNAKGLLRSVTKSCPKIKSFSTILNYTEELILLKYLVHSCNELNNLILYTNIDEMVDQLLKEQFGINEKWKVEREAYGKHSSRSRNGEINKFLITRLGCDEHSFSID
ncbi:hypothetical protein C1645_545274 [Glomus cerebriforme]|uniref:F-box domain-containing protein n=1 Tax=Glomus cerebriforme TaxID=658196 RepID=A0A397SGY2_9GLOM|nr:hypothetical protein C1645_545274 [Glomus cerebriforme]